MSSKQAFAYYLRVYNKPIQSKEFDYLTYYAQVFDNANYLKYSQDEFEVKKYSQGLYNIVQEEKNNVNFNDKFILEVIAHVGEYSFDDNAFPVILGMNWMPSLHYIPNRLMDLEIVIGKIINVEDLDWKLYLKEETAKSFINRRKDQNGRIDRSVRLRLTYSIVNQTTSKSEYIDLMGHIYTSLCAYIYSIDILDQYANQGEKPIGQIVPKKIPLSKLADKDYIEQNESFLLKNKGRAGVIVTQSGLQYEVIKMGTGPKPTTENTVKVHYVATLIDGTEFDSSIKRNEPSQFPVSGVIPGWIEALQLMPVGSKFKLVLPQSLAYGATGAGDVIKPFSTLIFEVELLDIVK